MTIDLYETMENARMLGIEKDKMQTNMNECLDRLEELEGLDDKLNRVNHEDSNLLAANQFLVKEQVSLKAELDVERSNVKTCTKASGNVCEIIESQTPVGLKVGLG